MFEPVSNLEYLRIEADRQILVAASGDVQAFAEKWKGRAAAAFQFTAESDLTKLAADLLANPHIRAIVIVDDGPGTDRIRRFWETREGLLPGAIEEWLVKLVTQWVDIFDEDCSINLPLPPFWPERIFLGETKEQK